MTTLGRRYSQGSTLATPQGIFRWQGTLQGHQPDEAQQSSEFLHWLRVQLLNLIAGRNIRPAPSSFSMRSKEDGYNLSDLQFRRGPRSTLLSAFLAACRSCEGQARCLESGQGRVSTLFRSSFKVVYVESLKQLSFQQYININ